MTANAQREATPGAAASVADDLPALRAELRAIGAEFCAVVGDLTPVAERLQQAESRLRVAEGRAGVNNPKAPARECAADVVHGALVSLRPYLPFVSEEGVRRARAALCGTRVAPRLDSITNSDSERT